MEELETNVIEEFEYRIKTAYMRKRAYLQAASASISCTDRWNTHWRNAALICINNRINPENFVEVQFDAVKPFPDPSALVGPNALPRYYERRKAYESSMLEQVAIQSKVFEKFMVRGFDAKAALLNECQNFDPLFIYITATVREWDDIASAYFERALVQYLTSVNYDAVYGEKVPEALRAAAGGVRRCGDGS